MKKVTKPQKSNNNSNFLNFMSKYSDKGDQVISLENVNPYEKENIEKQLKDIDSKIEDIGKICDKKKLKSYEEYNNILKSNKSQFLDELTKLNFKLMEAIKQNTREDFLQKLKKDLSIVKNQVYDKDKELQTNNNSLYVLENKVNLLQEEKEFVSKEISNAKQYNAYLKNKLKELEIVEGNKNETKVTTGRVDNSLTNTSRILKTSFEPNVRNREKEYEKVENYFMKNEDILRQKILNEEKQIREKYTKYKVLEAFKNPIQQMLNSKVKDYEYNLINSKVSNQEVFFNVPENDISSTKTKRRLFNKGKENLTYDYGLTKTDKKEILKEFLQDMDVKKYIYELLYEN